ncbi:MAG: ribonuclease Z [Candidatus Altiarchaeales archaeon]|nr:MAG: ribonuclease Z [Candidatus Altiarchaeales archaeon ex4484_43]RLI88205.1 MAG: ribonuclease Z [Candidatus Altiarchaeales archaeon]HDI72697.1 ribonuclease Z [Candidatus Altiarchaeales archaeon]
MELIFLGTSGCVPTKERGLSSILLDYLNEYFLFDCGEGTQRQMRIAGINFMRIDKVFVTHLHADHFLGLGGMIQSMDFLERTRPLDIYGPRGLEKTMEHMLSMGTFKLDSLEVRVHEIDEGVVLKGDRYTISCARTMHTNHSLAYCFEEDPKRKFLKQKAISLGIPEGRLFSKLQRGETIELKGKKITPDQVLSDPIRGRKVVYTGDTRVCNSVIELAKNADILIHDGTYSHEDIERESVKKAGHSTAKQAAEVAKKANVKKLYLTHISQRYPDAKPLEREAREVFKESYVAEDFMKVRVERHDI